MRIVRFNKITLVSKRQIGLKFIVPLYYMRFCARDCRGKPTARLFRRCADLQRKARPLVGSTQILFI